MALRYRVGFMLQGPEIDPVMVDSKRVVSASYYLYSVAMFSIIKIRTYLLEKLRRSMSYNGI